ncbi:hypothetical protein [Ruminococcus flavefaciens]|uniref:hypothetical protein n=1 Tax=Ruminococcus flavefaciens TaxID=1265 RepID=UPI0026F1DE31|nr:hypothetical protein [Ruminococcus flavefaciens]
MSKKDTFISRLNEIILPMMLPDTSKPPNTYDSFYKPILEKLGVSSAKDVDALRLALEEKVLLLSEEVRMQTIQDFMSGKIKDISEAPLFRENGSVKNIPDNLAPWMCFIAWLNARGTELF